MKSYRRGTAAEKRRINGRLILAVLLAAVVLLSVRMTETEAEAAAAEEVHVYDETGILDASECERLETLCGAVDGEQRIHILLLMTNNTGGKTAEEYADDFYDKRYPDDRDENGMAVLIDFGQRQMWISTAGIMRYYLNDSEIEDILDQMYRRTQNGDYAGALEAAVREAEAEIEKGVSSGDYLIDENGRIHHYRRITAMEALIAAAAGAGVFCAVFFGVRSSYRKKQETAAGYARTTDMQLTERRDFLENRHVSVRRIPKSPPPGSGGSTVHTSSSGRSHGGGGRSF